MQSRFDFNNNENSRRGASGSNRKPDASSRSKNSVQKSNKEEEKSTKKKKSNTLIFPRKNDISFKFLFYTVLVLVAVYIVFCVYKFANSKNIATYQVKEGALNEQNTYTGLILREEKIYYAQSDGYYNFYLKEGEKASHNDLV